MPDLTRRHVTLLPVLYLFRERQGIIKTNDDIKLHLLLLPRFKNSLEEPLGLKPDGSRIPFKEVMVLPAKQVFYDTGSGQFHSFVFTDTPAVMS